MKTSYFAKYKKEDGVSISLYKPKWFNGEEYKQLAPPSFLLWKYKNGEVNNDEYVEIYKKYTLEKLDASQVYEDLQDKVLLCYEKSSDFCHRHIVAEWIYEKLGIKVNEI